MGGYILLYSLLAGTAEVLLQATMGGYILLYSLLAGTAEVLPLIFRVSNGRHAWLLAGRLAGRLFFFFLAGARGSWRRSGLSPPFPRPVPAPRASPRAIRPSPRAGACGRCPGCRARRRRRA